MKARDPKGLKAWYAEHLGVPLTYGMTIFEGPEAAGATVLEFFAEDTKKFGEGEEAQAQRAMLNFRVDVMQAVLARLQAAGARIDGKQESDEFGKFAWFWDPEGNRVELWEPAPEEAE